MSKDSEIKKSIRDQILSVTDLKTKKVKVPEWDMTVTVGTLVGNDRDRFEQSVVQGNGSIIGVRALLVALTVVDENGQRVFTDDDAKELGKKSGAALDRIFAVAQQLNGLQASAIEDLEKN